MADDALSEAEEATPEIGMGAKQAALLEKTNALSDAASASCFGADEAAKEAKTTYDESKVTNSDATREEEA